MRHHDARFTLSSLLAVCALAASPVALAQSSAGADRADDAVKTPLPPAPVQLSVDAQAACSPWTLRVLNSGDVPVRIQADARLLTLLVRPNGKKYVLCSLPAAMSDEIGGRALVLEPGASYIEKFDPRLFCFGEVVDQFGADTSVTAFWGYKPSANPAHAGNAAPPFVAEPARAPVTFAAQKRLVSQTVWIVSQQPAPSAQASSPARPASAAATPDGKPGAQSTDDKSAKADSGGDVGVPKLALQVPRRIDTDSIRDARIAVVVKNVGDRAALVHLRPDRLQLRVVDPSGAGSVCGPLGRGRAAVRDFFHTLGPRASEGLTVLLAEACPRELFDRPGVYELTTSLHVSDDGRGFGLKAWTGKAKAESDRATLLRVRHGSKPYHAAAPSAVAADKSP
jgi:hypothetical protein